MTTIHGFRMNMGNQKKEPVNKDSQASTTSTEPIMPLPPRGVPEKIQIASVKMHHQIDATERDDMLDQLSALEFEANKKKTPDENSPDV